MPQPDGDLGETTLIKVVVQGGKRRDDSEEDTFIDLLHASPEPQNYSVTPYRENVLILILWSKRISRKYLVHVTQPFEAFHPCNLGTIQFT